VRDLDTIDSELRLITAVRRTIREQGVEPSSRQGRRIVERVTPASVHAIAKVTLQQKSADAARTITAATRTIRSTVGSQCPCVSMRCQLSEVVASDTDVKEVVRTMLRRKNDIPPFAQVAGPDMAFRDAVTFEVAGARLCQLGAVWPQHLGTARTARGR